jgi:ABC-2 type transport system permease protein
MTVPNSGTNVDPSRTSGIAYAARLFYWSVRRELWENRAIYVAPLAAGALFLAGFLISLVTLPHRMRVALELDIEKQRDVVAMPYEFAAGLLMVVTLIVAVFYCLDALYGERRDRSLLFWKSMPVSDLTVVLAKASVPIVILQVLSFAVTMALYCIMVPLSGAVLAGSGLSVATMWEQLRVFHMSMGLLYHLIALHGLGFAPFYCWFLLVSSWARRAPFLWAVLPPVAIGIVEKVAFNTTYFADLLGWLFGGGDSTMTAANSFPISPNAHVMPLRFLGSPDLWAGLILAAVFLLAAARMRRYREPG